MTKELVDARLVNRAPQVDIDRPAEVLQSNGSARSLQSNGSARSTPLPVQPCLLRPSQLRRREQIGEPPFRLQRPKPDRHCPTLHEGQLGLSTSRLQIGSETRSTTRRASSEGGRKLNRIENLCDRLS